MTGHLAERLLALVFFGVLVVLGCREGATLAILHVPALADHWVVVFVTLPSLLLLALGYGLGFYRRGQSRRADLIAILLGGTIVFLCVPASYSCGLGCF